MPVAQYPTLVDLASRLDQEGHIIPIAEVLSKRDPILKLLRWKECNKTDGYLHGIRTGIPEPTFRKLYQGSNRRSPRLHRLRIPAATSKCMPRSTRI